MATSKRVQTLLLLAFFVCVFAHRFPALGAHPLLGAEKLTKVHFFLHDTLSGSKPSAVLVAHRENHTGVPNDPTPFGTTFVIDDPLTAGPELDSGVVGNAQGLYVSSGQGPLSLVLGVDFELTAGPYSGSSFVVFSRNPVTEPHRELAVVGGRGAFRLARGFAQLRTHYLNTTNGDAVIEYDVTLLHY
ncbi:Dirigent protein 4 [Ananas comosus]|uniref:Dirigent protein n=1 Tax=Ananas comosus TaxID=4615 RepID=A0A199UYB9_ANACO|nr:Dirigent protein 4 [Ananas comosus]